MKTLELLGPWAGAVATTIFVFVTVLLSAGYFDRFRGPRIFIAFEAAEPWVRQGRPDEGRKAMWIRLSVQNLGHRPARGCVGRLTGVRTEGQPHRDIDPVQLRWAGVPRSQGFNGIDLRRNQCEFINVLCLVVGVHWHVVTFENPDFDPGFGPELSLDARHAVEISIFSDNAPTVMRSLVARASSTDGEVELRLV